MKHLTHTMCECYAEMCAFNYTQCQLLLFQQIFVKHVLATKGTWHSATKKQEWSLSLGHLHAFVCKTNEQIC